MRLFEAHFPPVLQVRLVADKEDDDILVCVVIQLAGPLFLNAFEASEGGYVIDEKCTDRIAVIGIRDGPVPLLACGVPDLSANSRHQILHLHARLLDMLEAGQIGDLVLSVLNVDAFGGELDSDGRWRLHLEFVFRKTQKQVRFADARVAN